MKWVNHQIVGFSLPFLFTGDPVFSAIAAATSVFPDFIEGTKQQKVMKHRGGSHNPFVWAVPALFFLAAVYHFLQPILLSLAQLGYFVSPYRMMYYAFGAVVGIYSHLFADALTNSGIPITPLSKERLAFKLFATGTSLEYVSSYLLLLAALATNFYDKF